MSKRVPATKPHSWWRPLVLLLVLALISTAYSVNLPEGLATEGTGGGQGPTTTTSMGRDH